MRISTGLPLPDDSPTFSVRISSDVSAMSPLMRFIAMTALVLLTALAITRTEAWRESSMSREKSGGITRIISALFRSTAWYAGSSEV